MTTNDSQYTEAMQNHITQQEARTEDVACREVPSVYQPSAQDRHRFRNIICPTGPRGESTPGGHNPFELRVHAGTGFINLWHHNVTLRWRFNDGSLDVFQSPDAARSYLRALLALALQLWDDHSDPDAAPYGPIVPVRFTEVGQHDAYDFEVSVSATNDCDANGRCVLGSAFFPDGGQHNLLLFPMMFQQSVQEQVETTAHELGHVFGLRHWFAALEGAAELFGRNSKFSIMNYGDDSFMTDTDREDLHELYRAARAGHLTAINGTPIRLVRPHSDPCNNGLI